MKRFATFTLAVLAPLACSAQPTEMPRAWHSFAAVEGYDDLSPDRFGTPAYPAPSEMGMALVQRMFRNVCLALERGDTLDAVMPPGFAAYGLGPYMLGTADSGTDGIRILSSTGEIALDEDGGHPAIWLRPADTGMTCAIEWTMAEPMPPERHAGFALLLRDWLPYAFAMVRASRPVLAAELAPSDLLEWDRPCLDGWCPVTANYMLQQGYVRLETRLGITEIGGERP